MQKEPKNVTQLALAHLTPVDSAYWNASCIRKSWLY